MTSSDAIFSLKAGMTSVTLAAVAANRHIDEVSIPFLGVSLTTITMAAAGAACAFAWSSSSGMTRRQLFAVAIASTLVGSACVTVIPRLFHEEWPENLQPPLAFLFGLLATWIVPALRGAIPALFRGLAALAVRIAGDKSQGGYGGGGYKPREYRPGNRDEEKGDDN